MPGQGEIGGEWTVCSMKPSLVFRETARLADAEPLPAVGDSSGRDPVRQAEPGRPRAIGRSLRGGQRTVKPIHDDAGESAVRG